MIGKLLDGRYKIVQALSSGGFGETYIAEDTRRVGNPKCVVKRLIPGSNNPNYLQIARRLFYSEAETLEKLGDHNQIPRPLAYFEEDQEFYLVQDFIEGHPLSTEIKPGERWNETKVIELLQDILSILDYVHSNSVIHRDIKPDNLIRRQRDSKLVLIDFGAVKQVRSQVVNNQSQMTATVAIGTPGYMPAEQGQGKPRPNSDIYALGIIAIQALTGMNPSQFQEDHNTGEIIWQNYTQVSNHLGTILNKMVRYDYRRDRYQSVSEVLYDLNQLVYSVTPTQPVMNWYPKQQINNQYPPIYHSIESDKLKKILSCIGIIFYILIPIISILSPRQVNFSTNQATLLCVVVVYLVGFALCSLALWRPALARYHDIIFAQFIALFSVILLYKGWRLDPSLQLGQLLLVASCICSIIECIRLRIK